MDNLKEMQQLKPRKNINFDFPRKNVQFKDYNSLWNKMDRSILTDSRGVLKLCIDKFISSPLSRGR